MSQVVFPFSAILGQDALKTALLLNAVDPTLGGVLIRGQKGTGKSTAARSLAALLPDIEVVDDCPYHCRPDRPEDLHEGCRRRLAAGPLPSSRRPTPLVDLPLGATEDRLVGTLHLERALQSGERHFQPGLLAAANRGILYVDEVNLLPDHLVDLLLDVAASGVNIVERDGLQLTHPARFLLIGTMNPEEGELRPQFLDRFALLAEAAGLEDPADRSEIVRRRLAFEANPTAFQKTWQAAEMFLAGQILGAQKRLEQVAVPSELIERAVRLAITVGSHGHRADIALVKAARAHAALIDRATVTVADLVEAARLALPHRLQSDPLDSPGKIMSRIDDALARAWGGNRPITSLEPEEPDDGDLQGESMTVPGATAAGSMLFSFLKKKLLQT